MTAADTVVTVNWQLAQGYRTALNAMSERMDLKNDVTVGMLARFPDVLTQTAAPTNEEELWQDVQSVAGQGAGRLCGHARHRRRKNSRKMCRGV